MTGLLLAIFLGWAGGYRFYKGQKGLGVLYLLTFGICGIGWMIDVILAIIAFVKSQQPKTMVIQCQIMGAWAECNKDPQTKRPDIVMALQPGAQLVLEKSTYQGAPFYQVCIPGGLDIGALPSKISKDLLRNYEGAHFDCVLTKVDREAPEMQINVLYK